MKKVIINTVALIALSISSNAQSIDDIQDYLADSKFLKAKEAAVLTLANTKYSGKADAWYYSALAYHGVAKDSTIKNTCATCKMDALNAFKKYQELDKNNTRMIVDNNVYLWDLYNMAFNDGAQAYEAGKFATAAEEFNIANEIGSYINSKGFTYNDTKISALDTNLINNIALCFEKAGDTEKSAMYYKKLFDINIATNEIMPAYYNVADRLYKAGNKQAAEEIINKAIKLYPAEFAFTELKLLNIENTNKVEYLNNYKQAADNFPAKYEAQYNYCAELYNYLYGDEKLAPEDLEKGTAELQTYISRVQAIKNGKEIAMLKAKSMFNNMYYKQENLAVLKGDAKTVQAQKDAIKAAQKKEAALFLPIASDIESKYFEGKAVSGADKSEYKNLLTMLSNVYNIMGDAKKAEEYKKKSAAL
jgi:tetratricopeptide (TPR) repeat protein